MEIILNSQFKLRPWKSTDAEALVRHANNEKIARNLRDGFPYPYTMEDAISWLKLAMSKKDALLLAVDHQEEVIGSVGMSPFKDVYRKTAEIGYWLSEEYWKRGITTLSVNALIDLAFNNHDLIRLQAGTFEGNLPSARVLEKCGFHLEAIHKNAVIKNGEVLDEYMYVLLKEDYLKMKENV